MTDAVVRELAAAAGLSIWPPRDDERLVVGDPETRHSLVLRSGSWLVERLDRGRAETEAACSDAAAGRALLVRHLAAGVRGHRGWPPIDHTRLAPGTRLEEVPDGQRLSWSHGWAVFRAGRSGELAAIALSWVVSVGVPEYAASFQRADGSPLFTLDPSVLRNWPPRRTIDVAAELRPVVSTSAVADRRPVEETSMEDLAVIGAAAAAVGWHRRPAIGVDVLAIGKPGDDQDGRSRSSTAVSATDPSAATGRRRWRASPTWPRLGASS